MVNISSIGLNMSEFTNSVTFFSMDAGNLSREIIESVMSLLVNKFNQTEMPVLFFNSKKQMEDIDLPSEKKYHLWILSLKYTDHYFKNMKRLIRYV